MSNIVHYSRKDRYSNIKVLKYSVNKGLTICIFSREKGISEHVMVGDKSAR